MLEILKPAQEKKNEVGPPLQRGHELNVPSWTKPPHQNAKRYLSKCKFKKPSYQTEGNERTGTLKAVAGAKEKSL